MKKIILISFILNSITFSQINGERFSVFFGGDYITSSQIFLNPNSSDIVIRNESFEIVDLFAPSIDVRYRLYDEMLIGLGTEYISQSAIGPNATVIEGSQIRQIEVEDGVVFIPIELSIHYLMPFSTESFSFTMSGGIGYYLGSHTRILGDTEIENISKNNAIGLLVSLGMEYRFYNQFGARLDMKFRDPEIKITSKYKSEIVNYKGRQLRIQQNEFDTKVNLNGISFLLGFTYHF